MKQRLADGADASSGLRDVRHRGHGNEDRILSVPWLVSSTWWPARLSCIAGGEEILSIRTRQPAIKLSLRSSSHPEHIAHSLLSCFSTSLRVHSSMARGLYNARQMCHVCRSARGSHSALPPALPMIPDSPDIFVPQSARVSVKILHDSAAEASDSARSMMCVRVVHVGMRLRWHWNASTGRVLC